MLMWCTNGNPDCCLQWNCSASREVNQNYVREIADITGKVCVIVADILGNIGLTERIRRCEGFIGRGYGELTCAAR